MRMSYEVFLGLKLRCYVGISLKTQELYALVFVTRYLDLFTDFISVYNTVMKMVFVGSTLAIVWCMRRHRVVRRSYDRELDTFRHYFLVAGCFALALVLHEKFTFQEVLAIFKDLAWCGFVSFDLIWGIRLESVNCWLQLVMYRV